MTMRSSGSRLDELWTQFRRTHGNLSLTASETLIDACLAELASEADTDLDIMQAIGDVELFVRAVSELLSSRLVDAKSPSQLLQLCAHGHIFLGIRALIICGIDARTISTYGVPMYIITSIMRLLELCVPGPTNGPVWLDTLDANDIATRSQLALAMQHTTACITLLCASDTGSESLSSPAILQLMFNVVSSSLGHDGIPSEVCDSLMHAISLVYRQQMSPALTLATREQQFLKTLISDVRDKPLLPSNVVAVGRALGAIMQQATTDEQFDIIVAFGDADGYAVLAQAILSVLDRCADVDSAVLIGVLGDLVYVPEDGVMSHTPRLDSDSPDDCTSEGCVSELYSAPGRSLSHTSCRHFRNQSAFVALTNIFLQSPSDQARTVVLDSMTEICDAHPWNHVVLRHSRPLVKLVAVIPRLSAIVQRRLIQMFEYVMCIHDEVPREELCALTSLFLSPLAHDTVALILTTLCKFLKRDASKFASAMSHTDFLQAYILHAKNFAENSGDYHLMCDDLRTQSTDLVLSVLQNSIHAVETFRTSGGTSSIANLLAVDGARVMALMILQTIASHSGSDVRGSDMDVLVGAMHRKFPNMTAKARREVFDGLRAVLAEGRLPGDTGGWIPLLVANLNGDDCDTGDEDPLESKMHLVQSALCLLVGACELSADASCVLRVELGLRTVREAIKASSVVEIASGEFVVSILMGLASQSWAPVSRKSDGSGRFGQISLMSPHAAVIALTCCPLLTDGSQRDVVEQLLHFVQRSRANANAAARADVVSVLLNEYENAIVGLEHPLHDVISALLRCCCREYCSVQNRKRLLQWGTVGPHCNAVMPLLLDLAAQSSEGSYFEFDSKRTPTPHLDFPDFAQLRAWPPQAGFSTSMWFCVESDSEDSMGGAVPQKAPIRSAWLFAIGTAADSVIPVASASIVDGRLVFQSAPREERSYSKFEFQYNNWYHVVLSVHRTKSSGRFVFVVDGVVRDDTDVPLTSTNGQIRFTVGPATTTTKTAASKLLVGPCCLFSEPLSHAAAFSLFNSGRDFLPISHGTTAGILSDPSQARAPTRTSSDPILEHLDALDPNMPKTITPQECESSLQHLHDVCPSLLLATEPYRVTGVVSSTPGQTSADAHRIRNEAQPSVRVGYLLAGAKSVCTFNLLECLGTQSLLLIVQGLKGAANPKVLHMTLQLLRLALDASIETRAAMRQLELYDEVALTLMQHATMVDYDIIWDLLGIMGITEDNLRSQRASISNVVAFQRFVLQNQVWRKIHEDCQQLLFQITAQALRTSEYRSSVVAKLRGASTLGQLVQTALDPTFPHELLTHAIAIIETMLEESLYSKDVYFLGCFITGLMPAAADILHRLKGTTEQRRGIVACVFSEKGSRLSLGNLNSFDAGVYGPQSPLWATGGMAGLGLPAGVSSAVLSPPHSGGIRMTDSASPASMIGALPQASIGGESETSDTGHVDGGFTAARRVLLRERLLELVTRQVEQCTDDDALNEFFKYFSFLYLSSFILDPDHWPAAVAALRLSAWFLLKGGTYRATFQSSNFNGWQCFSALLPRFYRCSSITNHVVCLLFGKHCPTSVAEGEELSPIALLSKSDFDAAHVVFPEALPVLLTIMRHAVTEDSPVPEDPFPLPDFALAGQCSAVTIVTAVSRLLIRFVEVRDIAMDNKCIRHIIDALFAPGSVGIRTEGGRTSAAELDTTAVVMTRVDDEAGGGGLASPIALSRSGSTRDREFEMDLDAIWGHDESKHAGGTLIIDTAACTAIDGVQESGWNFFCSATGKRLMKLLALLCVYSIKQHSSGQFVQEIIESVDGIEGDDSQSGLPPIAAASQSFIVQLLALTIASLRAVLQRDGFGGNKHVPGNIVNLCVLIASKVQDGSFGRGGGVAIDFVLFVASLMRVESRFSPHPKSDITSITRAMNSLVLSGAAAENEESQIFLLRRLSIHQEIVFHSGNNDPDFILSVAGMLSPLLQRQERDLREAAVSAFQAMHNLKKSLTVQVLSRKPAGLVSKFTGAKEDLGVYKGVFSLLATDAAAFQRWVSVPDNATRLKTFFSGTVERALLNVRSQATSVGAQHAAAVSVSQDITTRQLLRDIAVREACCVGALKLMSQIQSINASHMRKWTRQTQRSHRKARSAHEHLLHRHTVSRVVLKSCVCGQNCVLLSETMSSGQNKFIVDFISTSCCQRGRLRPVSSQAIPPPLSAPTTSTPPSDPTESTGTRFRSPSLDLADEQLAATLMLGPRMRSLTGTDGDYDGQSLIPTMTPEHTPERAVRPLQNEESQGTPPRFPGVGFTPDPSPAKPKRPPHHDANHRPITGARRGLFGGTVDGELSSKVQGRLSWTSDDCKVGVSADNFEPVSKENVPRIRRRSDLGLVTSGLDSNDLGITQSPTGLPWEAAQSIWRDPPPSTRNSVNLSAGLMLSSTGDNDDMTDGAASNTDTSVPSTPRDNSQLTSTPFSDKTAPYIASPGADVTSNSNHHSHRVPLLFPGEKVISKHFVFACIGLIDEYGSATNLACTLLVTSRAIHIIDVPGLCQVNKSGACLEFERAFDTPLGQKWITASFLDVAAVARRRHLLQPVAVEIFLTSGKHLFLVAGTEQARERIIATLAPSVQGRGRADSFVTHGLSLIVGVGGSPEVLGSVAYAGQGAENVPSVLGNGEDVSPWDGTSRALRGMCLESLPVDAAMSLWQRGFLTNFDYLMVLNVLAGRTTSDLNQYPVFPWVLADYDSDVLDLTDPATFRDLSKPMGMQEPTRAQYFKTRFDEWVDQPNVPPFHYGSHYSNAAIVIHYLIRLQPFTSEFAAFQSGWDHADRLFSDLRGMWRLASGNAGIHAEVRELIPEFFYCPEFLQCEFDTLGTTQDGESVRSVRLPPWAKGSADVFIKRHRQALESEYVTAHLHEWVDLIFGFKQLGPAAVEAGNTFHALTYQDGVDLNGLTPEDHAAALAQIYHFGQTPSKLFKRPHPTRGVQVQPSTIWSSGRNDVKSSIVLRVRGHRGVGDVGVAMDGSIVATPGSRLLLPPRLARAIDFGLSPDGTLRILTAEQEDRQSLACFPRAHGSAITAMSCSEDGRTVVTGGSDCMIRVWRQRCPSKKDRERGFGKWWLLTGTLDGHESQITAMAVSVTQACVLSGACDGSLICWHLERLEPIRTLTQHQRAVTTVAVGSLSGTAISSCKRFLRVHSKNGVLLAQLALFAPVRPGLVSAVTITKHTNAPEWLIDSKVATIVTGHADGSIRFWALSLAQQTTDATTSTPNATPAAIPVSVSETPFPTPFTPAKYASPPTKAKQPPSFQVEYELVESAVMIGHTASVTALHITKDQQRLLSGDSDGIVRKWGAYN